MDPETLAAYDKGAAAFAEDWENQPPPTDMYGILRRFFVPGLTADIGCGSGRDTAWLVDNGFPARGYDASEALLREARKRHPGIEFVNASLPDLEGIADQSYTNVLCETVLMHLPASSVRSAMRRLVAILAPHGVLYASWRVTPGSGTRDPQGRLYESIDAADLLADLPPAGIQLNRSDPSLSSGKLVHRLVLRRA